MCETGRVQMGRSNREGRGKCYKENHDSAGADHRAPEQVLPSSPGTPRTRATERTAPELLLRAGAGRQHAPASTGQLLGLRHMRCSPQTHTEPKMPNASTKIADKNVIFSKINIQLSKINF